MYQSIENITFIIAFAFYVVAALLFFIQIARLSKRVERWPSQPPSVASSSTPSPWQHGASGREASVQQPV